MSERIVGDRYVLRRRLLKGDAVRGEPELWQAQDAGDYYFVKMWERRGDDRSDIRALWNREVRSMRRLQGYPDADQYFMRLQDLGVRDECFYVVLEGGRRALLSDVLEKRQNVSWLSSMASPMRRRPIWEGLGRIAEALDILHQDGTLHRTLSPSSIFVGPDGNGDFRLSGFEWSLRVAGNDGAASRPSRAKAVRPPELDHAGSEEFGTATDWFDFGLVAAEIFGAPVRSVRKLDTLRGVVAALTTLREREKTLLLSLLEAEHDKRPSDGASVVRAIREITTGLDATAASVGRPLTLAVRLGESSPLSKAVAFQSERAAASDDPEAQRAWIERDLRGDPRVVGRSSPRRHFVVRGERLEYIVWPWEVKGSGSSTWDIGYCDDVEDQPRSVTGDEIMNRGERPLHVRTYPRVRNSEASVRDKSAAWDKVFPARQIARKVQSDLQDTHDFFRITQQIDTLLIAAQICPVVVIAVANSSNVTDIIVTPKEEPDRNELAAFLKLSPPSMQVADWFDLGAEEITDDDEDEPKRDFYHFLDRRTIARDHGSTIKWTFRRAEEHRGGPRYHFTSERISSVKEGNLVYLARNYGGTIAQIRRRHKAIEDMRQHEALLRFVQDPIGSSRVGVDQLPEARAAIDLDASKVGALERLWKVHPAFAIQGPPGTGKTTLIEAFSDRLLNDDQTAQILLTAHSHHTVDDVLSKLGVQFEKMPRADRPILLRLGSRKASSFDIGPTTDDVLAALRASELAQRSPEFLKARLEAASVKPDDSEQATAGQIATERSTLELLIQDAANITLTTSNSSELADLSRRGRRFDWSIIEEAGKAHGFDMAAALQSSHRQILIGDHYQLPPYNAGVFTDLLGDPLRVRKAIQSGAQFAPGLVDDEIVSDDASRPPFEDRCARWKTMVTFFGRLFEESMSAEVEESRPAATLVDQHRMHPDIADLVGKIFYPNESGDGTLLRTSPEAKARFGHAPPYSIVEGSWLPEHRVVWRDVDWLQKTKFAKGEVEGLFAAPVEAREVVETLRQLRPVGDKKCHIQILSPYNDQLAAIRREIDGARNAGDLAWMFEPPFDLSAEKRMGATVDEFQGSEADVVIVSLVRNNAVPAWRSLGFLREATRMNVLLSRSKH